MTKPMFCCDWDEKKVKFPAIAMPKIDGVRGCNLDGNLTARSLKPHGNRYTTKFYSKPHYFGFDGELAAESETHPDLCRITTSAINTHEGEPFTLWWLFDFITPATIDLPYIERLQLLSDIYHSMPHLINLRLVPWKIVNSLEELLAFDDWCLDQGYEGTIGRDPQGRYKQGRATAKESIYWRIKRFIEEDARVIGIEEGERNENEAQENELGKTFRATNAANMVPNGLVGNLQCEVLKDVYDPQIKDKLLLKKGQIITVSPGNMKADQRKFYFENQNEIVGKIISFKFFPKGIKDKPRFPTFKTIRAEEDMVDL